MCQETTRSGPRYQVFLRGSSEKVSMRSPKCLVENVASYVQYLMLEVKSINESVPLKPVWNGRLGLWVWRTSILCQVIPFMALLVPKQT